MTCMYPTAIGSVLFLDVVVRGIFWCVRISGYHFYCAFSVFSATFTFWLQISYSYRYLLLVYDQCEAHNFEYLHYLMKNCRSGYSFRVKLYQ